MRGSPGTLSQRTSPSRLRIRGGGVLFVVAARALLDTRERLGRLLPLAIVATLATAGSCAHGRRRSTVTLLARVQRSRD
jgi:hypothetical protein